MKPRQMTFNRKWNTNCRHVPVKCYRWAVPLFSAQWLLLHDTNTQHCWKSKSPPPFVYMQLSVKWRNLVLCMVCFLNNFYSSFNFITFIILHNKTFQKNKLKVAVHGAETDHFITWNFSPSKQPSCSFFFTVQFSFSHTISKKRLIHFPFIKALNDPHTHP